METIIQIKNLHKQFDQQIVLDGINLDVYPGEIISIIGPSGSGKSTLLRCINLLNTPTSGTILYHNTNIMEYHHQIDQIRTKVGMVFQSFHLFANFNVLKNCTVGPIKVLHQNKSTATHTALALLEQVGMKDFANSNVTSLSGGQKHPKRGGNVSARA